jgi:hypothetical protein
MKIREGEDTAKTCSMEKRARSAGRRREINRYVEMPSNTHSFLYEHPLTNIIHIGGLCYPKKRKVLQRTKT